VIDKNSYSTTQTQDLIDQFHGDGIWLVEPKAQPEPGRQFQVANTFQVYRDWDKIQYLESIMARAANEMQQVSGVYFQPEAPSGALSGVAIDSLDEISSRSQGRFNANYRMFFQHIGELMFAYVAQGIGTSRKIVHIPAQNGKKDMAVVLNDGITNRVADLMNKVAVQSVYSSTGYRDYVHKKVTEVMTKSGDPEVSKQLLSTWVLLTPGLPRREEVAANIAKANGTAPDSEEQQAAAQQAAMQQQEQLAQLEMQGKQAETTQKLADAKAKEAQAAKAMAEAEQTAEETRKMQLSNQANAAVMQLMNGRINNNGENIRRD
jgi:hypothetical protein